MKVKESLLKETIRLDSYKLLSECYYLPDEGFLKKIHSLDEPIAEPCSEIKRFVPEIIELESLVIDFSRLFVGPFKLLAPPYGSVYLENVATLMGESTIDVKRSYLEEGLDIAFKEAPDHIAIELEFMYLLIFKQMQAMRDSNYKEATSYLKKQFSFLNTNLRMWVPVFADKVEKNAQTLFYKNLARVSKLFIAQDSKGLSPHRGHI